MLLKNIFNFIVIALISFNAALILAEPINSSRFIKLDSNGRTLSNQKVTFQEQAWSCVLDKKTGLVWEIKTKQGLQKYSHTYSWSKSSLYKNKSTMNQKPVTGSNAQCHIPTSCDVDKYIEDFNHYYAKSGLCGFQGWRLPLAAELFQLIDINKLSPAIDLNFFPNTKSKYYWSSESFFGKINYYAWAVNFYHGVMDYNPKRLYRNVRLVTSSGRVKSSESKNVKLKVGEALERPFNYLKGCYTPPSNRPALQLYDNQDGTVSDLKNSLIWKQCTEGTFGDKCNEGKVTLLTWEEAKALVNNPSIDRSSTQSWRLPTSAELATLLDLSCLAPASSTTFFPNTANDYYWTSDEYEGNNWFAWSINFRDGVTHFSLKFKDRVARLVRSADVIDDAQVR